MWVCPDFLSVYKGFSCSLSDNKYKVEFVEFEIRDYDTSKSVFKVSKRVPKSLSFVCPLVLRTRGPTCYRRREAFQDSPSPGSRGQGRGFGVDVQTWRPLC